VRDKNAKDAGNGTAQGRRLPVYQIKRKMFLAKYPGLKFVEISV